MIIYWVAFFNMKRKIVRTLLVILSLCILLLAGKLFIDYENNHLEVSNFTIKNVKIPQAFSGYKILQLSDLHNKNFADKQQGLINLVKEQQPDIIVITGDIIDRTSTDFSAVTDLILGIKDIAPIYYCSGNHESQSPLYPELLEMLVNNGVIDLNNKHVEINLGTESLSLIGFFDPQFNELYSEDFKTFINAQDKNYRIIMAHRPEFITNYQKKYHANLVLAGHTHGGQINFPVIGPLFAPNQEFLPKYASGRYQVEETTLIVNRGLGNSTFPIRINNFPEIVLITLDAVSQ